MGVHAFPTKHSFDIPMGSSCVLNVCFGTVKGFADAAGLCRMEGVIHIHPVREQQKGFSAHSRANKGAELKPS